MKKQKLQSNDGLSLHSSGHYVGQSEQAGFWWLLSEFQESVWEIRPHLNGNPRSTWRVSWEPVWSNDKMRVHWPRWQKFGKRVALLLMEHPEKPQIKPSSLAIYCREIRSICEWFCFERRVAEVSSIRREDLEVYFDYLESLSLCQNTLMTKLSLLRRFNDFKELLGEGIEFDPFRAFGSLKGISKKLGRPPAHTKTIYPREFFHLLDSALRTLKQSSGILARLERYMDVRSTARNRNDLSRTYKRVYGESAAVVQEDARVLYGACLAVLLSLWGERKHELLSAIESDVTALWVNDAEEIIGVEHKTSGTLTGKRTERAAIAEVREALQVIFRLTKWTREKYQSPWFFLRLPFGHSASKNPHEQLTTTPLYRLLDAFSSRAGFEETLRPHMFRRSFSLLWAWRFETGDLAMLSKLLYHNNETFTRFYTEDENVWEFLPESERSLAFDVIRDVLIGSRKMTGALGATLERYRRLITARFGVLTVKKAERFARKLLQEGGYRIIANADGFCFINEARGHRAKCSSDGCTPNYANRSEKVCPECPNFGVDESRTEYWQKRKRSHEQVLQNTSVEMLADASRDGVARAEKVLSRIQATEIHC